MAVLQVFGVRNVIESVVSSVRVAGVHGRWVCVNVTPDSLVHLVTCPAHRSCGDQTVPGLVSVNADIPLNVTLRLANVHASLVLMERNATGNVQKVSTVRTVRRFVTVPQTWSVTL